MDAPHHVDQFPDEGASRLENNDELVCLLLLAFPPIPRLDGPVVGARGEPSLDDDASDRPRGLAVRRGHVGHRMRNPSAWHPISPLTSLSGSGTGMGSTAFYLVVLVCGTLRCPLSRCPKRSPPSGPQWGSEAWRRKTFGPSPTTSCRSSDSRRRRSTTTSTSRTATCSTCSRREASSRPAKKRS